MSARGIDARRILIILPVIASLLSIHAYAQGIYAVDEAKVVEKSAMEAWVNKYERAKRTVEGFRVDSVEEFVRINAYYDAFISDGELTHEFRTRFNEQIYCIDITTQGAIRASGLDPKSLQTAPEITPFRNSIEAEVVNDNSRHVCDFGLDGSPDENGNARICPEGSFPKLIPEIKTLYRRRKLEDLFKKYPGDRTTKTIDHIYAHAQRVVDNKGESADFNLWVPRTEKTSEFSLAQLWVARGTGADTETVETGWQHYRDLYGDDNSHLFLYFTPDAYGPGGCYNLACGAFVQVDSSVVIAGTLSPTSTMGGEQHSVTLSFIRDDAGEHHWWLKFGEGADAKWVGYYPNSLFDANGIANNAARIDYGGEIISNPSTPLTGTDMGSGSLPGAGWQYAAYIKQIMYVDLSYALRNSTGLTGYSTMPNYWDIGAINNTSDPNWLTYFYYGGPDNSCQNECTSDGVQQCVGDTQYALCGNHDADICLEWGPDTNCGGSTPYCIGATCVECSMQAHCSDNNVCNGQESCQSNSCVGGTSLVCNDGNPCTNNDCEPLNGCIHDFNTNTCDDGDWCTHNDRCSQGSCTGTLTDCSAMDGPCIRGVCDPADGTCGEEPVENGQSCDDAKPCTLGETCQQGLCIGGQNICPDAGQEDAGQEDAGQDDAGQDDAGSDTGPVDAGIDQTEDSGCGCSTGKTQSFPNLFTLFFCFAAVGLRRSRS
ncbi:MAG: neprosin family prolyl endopeptidase [Deltaproteobacteria bacterium]|nr:neprosin family prolyl endopeptidase [Deltaproteobacteria bacterium]